LNNFYTQHIAGAAGFHSTDEFRDLAWLEPATRAAAVAIIAGAAAIGITLFATETYRSVERQAMLYAKGATHLKNVGVHHFGLAVDFAKLIDGKASWAGDWAFLGRLAESQGLIWGGDWGLPAVPHTFRDFDHVQRCTLGEQTRLFAGTWYPEAA
jgi:hypothetical protein